MKLQLLIVCLTLILIGSLVPSISASPITTAEPATATTDSTLRVYYYEHGTSHDLMPNANNELVVKIWLEVGFASNYPRTLNSNDFYLAVKDSSRGVINPENVILQSGTVNNLYYEMYIPIEEYMSASPSQDYYLVYKGSQNIQVIYSNISLTSGIPPATPSPTPPPTSTPTNSSPTPADSKSNDLVLLSGAFTIIAIGVALVSLIYFKRTRKNKLRVV